ncbi:Metallo-dependent phosphatase [Amylostereum chailletii]|nr:Metallo-dependent phosphatase [Amylostereum chailletii]
MSNKPRLSILNRIPFESQSPARISLPKAIIHSNYDVSAPPPKPNGGSWTRFVCISDTHEQVFPVPDGDVLLHSGDLTHTGQYKGVRSAIEWLSGMSHPLKIIIAGNHDLSFHGGWYEENGSRWHRTLEDRTSVMHLIEGDNARQAGIVYLENEKIEFQARPGGKMWSVYGSPWTPEFFNWAFNYQRGEEAAALLATFEKTDILLTHGPPYDILDETTGHVKAGCQDLLARLPDLRPRLHLFGHIHEARGVQVGEWLRSNVNSTTDVKDNDGEHTVFVNAANWPSGKWKKNEEGWVPFGTGTFMPVIVDLLED